MTLPPRGMPPQTPGRRSAGPRYVEPAFAGQQYPVLPPGMLDVPQAGPEPGAPPTASTASTPEPHAASGRRSLPEGTIGVLALVVICVVAIGAFFLVRGVADRGTTAAPDRTIQVPSADDRTAVQELFEDWIRDMNRSQWDAALARLCPEATGVRREVEQLQREVERGGSLRMAIAIQRVTVSGERATVVMDLRNAGESLGTRSGTARRDGTGWCILG